ncbi:MAG TPA: helix-turn-helix domain-containing protein [Steroidobacteraceae bacterium]|nr:helix-turn-helix domain-containing protein [Steroidobacteraceae bacterium]
MSARAGLASPGALLKSARESRGLSIEEAADRLRLNEALVLAMEEDRFGLLGAPVFARGHLRNYAALIGAPEREVMEAFDVGDVPEPTFLPALDHAPVSRSRGRGRWIVAVVLVAAAAAAAAWFALRD